jgi:Ca-activated chloride channel family protein
VGIRLVRPPEGNTEKYARVDESRFVSPRQHPLSTFSVDVDTASYANVRRFLGEEQLPPPDAVRIEELLNYFRYDYPPSEEAVSVHTEVGDCPWNGEHRLVLVAVRGRTPAPRLLPPARNLVFLVDVSGSMDSPDKLPLLKASLERLIEQLGPRDRLAIVVYAGAAGLVMNSTPGDRHADMKAALAVLQAGGSTNGGEGIQLAYRVARENFLPEGVNRVVLATDGDFNVGVTSDGGLTRLIETEREGGVYLSVLGFGRGNLGDSTMEALADRGNGNYAYVDSLREAEKVLVREGDATLVTVAKDVKIQVELNPARVSGYRLIGYENRRLQDEDFRDDAKDAGEIGAGGSVTALYEIVPIGAPAPVGRVDPLKYQAPVATAAGAAAAELMTVKVRFKSPVGGASTGIETVVADVASPDGAPNLHFASAVAEFGLLLRGSPFKAQASYGHALKEARSARGDDPYGDRAEFEALVAHAAKLAGRQRAVAVDK